MGVSRGKMAMVAIACAALGVGAYYFSDLPVQAASYEKERQRAKERGFKFSNAGINAVLQKREEQDIPDVSAFTPNFLINTGLPDEVVKQSWVTAQPKLPAWRQRVEVVYDRKSGWIPYADDWGSLCYVRALIAVENNEIGIYQTCMDTFVRLFEAECRKETYTKMNYRVARLERVIGGIVYRRWGDPQWMALAEKYNRRIDITIDLRSAMRINHAYACEAVASMEPGIEADPADTSQYPKFMLARMAQLHRWFVETYDRIPQVSESRPLTIPELRDLVRNLKDFEEKFLNAPSQKRGSFEPIQTQMVKYSVVAKLELDRREDRFDFTKMIEDARANPKNREAGILKHDRIFKQIRIGPDGLRKIRQ